MMMKYASMTEGITKAWRNTSSTLFKNNHYITSIRIREEAPLLRPGN